MASTYIFGVDKESDLVKIAKAYMAISGDGRSNLVCDNSLHAVDELQPPTVQAFVENNALRRFDCVLTNPPYGTKTKVLADDATNFELGHRWTERDGQRVKGKAYDTDPYVLFLERCLDMLTDGGVLAIVLPETAFHGPTKKFLRDHIQRRASIEAVIELPHNTFRPHCNAKTCLLVARKAGAQTDLIMAAPEEMGHDHKGEELYRLGTSKIWDDLPHVIKELPDPSDPATNLYSLSLGLSSKRQGIGCRATTSKNVRCRRRQRVVTGLFWGIS